MIRQRLCKFFACAVAALLLRSPVIYAEEPAQAPDTPPMSLPYLEPGDACPVTIGIRGAVPRQPHVFGGELWFGTGPVYLALAWKDTPGDEATFSLEPVPRNGNAYRAKTPWVSEPAYAGRILIRGRNLSASGDALRFRGNDPGARDRLELQAPRAPKPSLWSFWPSSMWVPGPGCYGLQIDTDDATDIVVFEAL